MSVSLVARVHAWVAQSLPEWFWKGRPELRFQAALAYERIRLLECDDDPETVMFLNPSWIYKRENRVASVIASQPPLTANSTSEPLSSPPLMQPHADLHAAPEFSPPPLNFIPAKPDAEIGVTPDAAIHSADPHLLRLAHHFAQILILWEKTQRHALTSPPHVGITLPRDAISSEGRTARSVSRISRSKIRSIKPLAICQTKRNFSCYHANYSHFKLSTLPSHA